jgi:hypothetical protein
MIGLGMYQHIGRANAINLHTSALGYL